MAGHKDLQDKLLENEQANLSFEMNLDEFVREWYDSYENETSSIRAYIERIISSVVDIEKQVPTSVLNYAGTGIDSLRDLLTNFDKLEKIEELNSKEKHVKEKLAKILLDAITKDISNIHNIFSVLIVTGAIHGSAAGIITPIGGFALAAFAWGAVGFSSAGLYRASRDYASPTYQLEDQLNRYQIVDKKIASTAQRIQKLKTKLAEYDSNNEKDKNKIRVLEQKIKHRELQQEGWIKRQEILKQKAISIIQFNNNNVKWHKEKPISPELKQKFITTVSESQAAAVKQQYQSLMKPAQAFVQALDEEISDENKKMMVQLKKNKRDLVISRTIKTTSLAVMAVGMTLTAVSPFTAHAAPIIMAVGMALIALGGAIQLGQTLSVKLVNMIAKKHQQNLIKKELIIEMNTHSKLALQDIMKDEDRLKYYLSFKMNQEKLKSYAKTQVQLGKLPSMPNQADLEAEWYKFVGNQSPKARKQLLDTAYKKTINEIVLRQTLGLKADQPIPEQLSEKAKNKIINRASRHTLRQSITEGSANLFKTAKEKVQVQYNNGAVKIQRLGLF